MGTLSGIVLIAFEKLWDIHLFFAILIAGAVTLLFSLGSIDFLNTREKIPEMFKPRKKFLKIVVATIPTLLVCASVYASQKKPPSHGETKRKPSPSTPLATNQTSGNNSPAGVTGDVTYNQQKTINNNVTNHISTNKYAEDTLVAGKKKRPTFQNCPSIADTSFVLIVGNNVFFDPMRLPFAALRVKNDSIIVINKTNNVYTISARLFGHDRRIIAKLVDNVIFVNQNNIGSVRRPDQSSITVFDQYDDKALSLVFLNKNTIQISGSFFTKSGDFFSIGETEVRAGSTIFAGNCASRFFFGFGFGDPDGY